MPNIEVKLRKGSATDHTSFAGALGEVTVDTTNQTLHVHNGSGTAGSGVALRRKDDTIAGSEIDNDAVGTAQIAANAVTSTEISSTDSTFSIDGDGNMGLGIAANSAAKLYIAGTGGNTFLAVKSDTMAAIDLEDSGAGTDQKHYQMVSLDGDFELRQINDDLTLKETPFTVNSSGEVGIAKTADTGYKLDVLGTIRTTDGNLFIAGDEAAFGSGNGPGIRIIYDDGAGTVETRDIFVKADGDWVFSDIESSSTPFKIKNNGGLNFGNIPTSSSGLSSGDVWNNSGVLNIVT